MQFCLAAGSAIRDEGINAEETKEIQGRKTSFPAFSRTPCQRRKNRTIDRSSSELTIAENQVKRRRKMKIKDLKNGMRRVDVTAKVVEKSTTREVRSRFKNEAHNVADAVVTDGTGTIKLTLWNEQIDQVNVNDTVKVENGYITSFRGEIQLNVGKYGKLTVE